MKKFNRLIEFIGKRGERFFNKDIRCPICHERMFYDDSEFDIANKEVRLICKNEHCKMQIEIKDYIIWDDIIDKVGGLTMNKSAMMDAVKNLEKAKMAADEALKPYGFRLCNVNDITINHESGILYTDCKLVFFLPNTDK